MSNLESLSDDALRQIVDSHERQMQMLRNSRRAGIFISRERSEGAADLARAILRRRAEDRKVVVIK